MTKKYKLPEEVLAARERLKGIMCSRLYRSPLKEHEVNLVVALRYGSVTSFDKIYMTWAEMGKRLTVAPQTLFQVVRKFHLNGNKFQKRRIGKCRPRALLPEVEATVCSREMLIKHQMLSIKERVIRI